MSAQLPRPPPAGGCLASRGKLSLAVQHQRERAMLLSDVDKSRQPAVDKHVRLVVQFRRCLLPSIAPIVYVNAVPRNYWGNQILHPLLLPLHLPLLLLMQFYSCAAANSREGHRQRWGGTNSKLTRRWSSRGDKCGWRDKQCCPSWTGPRIGRLGLSTIHVQQRDGDWRSQFCLCGFKLCQSVGNQASIMSICINCNLSAHHFCANYPCSPRSKSLSLNIE